MSTRLNVLIIIPELGQGGAERAISKLSLLLEPHHQIYFLQFNNLAQVYYPIAGELLYLNVLPSNNFLGKLSNAFKRIFRTRQIKTIYKIDVSISFLEGANYINVLSRQKDKVIISARGSISHDIEISKSIGWIRKTVLIPWLYEKADKVVALSEGLSEELIEQFDISPNKLEVIYNDYDLQRIEKSAKESISVEMENIFTRKTIVTSGRLHIQKGHSGLLEVFASIKNSFGSKYKLIIFGDGELKTQLIELSENMGLQTYSIWSDQDLNCNDDVYFMGFEKNPYKYISKCGVFVFPSLYEGLGNALVEALACEIPIMATDCHSGPREVLAPPSPSNYELKEAEYAKYGILMPHISNGQNIKVWHDTIINLLKTDTLKNRYQKIGAERITDFGNVKITNKWLNLIERIKEIRQ